MRRADVRRGDLLRPARGGALVGDMPPGRAWVNYKHTPLQVNTREKALDEIYKIHILLLYILFQFTISFASLVNSRSGGVGQRGSARSGPTGARGASALPRPIASSPPPFDT